MALRPFVEALEPRQLLSAPPASPAAMRWPTVPFAPRTPIYVNQFGYAELRNQPLKASAVKGYEFVFDDPGTVIVRTSAPLRTQLAFYDKPGAPARITPGRPRGGATIENPVHSKQIVHVAVRGRDARQHGRFDLIVEGVRHNVVRNLPIRPRTGAGTFQTTLSNMGDADFYEFTVSETGEWQVSVEPQSQLDATLNIFDADGNPAGGTYTQPIDARSAGGTEFWTAPLLYAGEQYFIRIDGKGAGLDRYHVRAQRILPPTLSIRTSNRFASEAGTAGEFIISRSSRSSIDQALSINYVVLGSALNGTDYPALTGSVLMPAGSRSVRITVTPMPDAETESEESVGLILLPGDGYDLAGKRLASMVIADNPPA